MDVRPWFNQRAFVARVATSTDSYGNPKWSTPVPVMVRHQKKVQMVRRGADGTERKSTDTVYSGDPIGEQDRFWFPGVSTADASFARTPLEVRTEVDKGGKIVFYEIFF